MVVGLVLHETKKNSIKNVHVYVVLFFLRLVYPSILFVFCLFMHIHSHSCTRKRTGTHSTKCLQQISYHKRREKSHERKCDYQSMSHRKSIKCLHHSTALVPFLYCTRSFHVAWVLLPILIGSFYVQTYILLWVTMGYVFITICHTATAFRSLFHCLSLSLLLFYLIVNGICNLNCEFARKSKIVPPGAFFSCFHIEFFIEIRGIRKIQIFLKCVFNYFIVSTTQFSHAIHP